MEADGLPPWAATCLAILRAAGARVAPATAECPGVPAYRVELPEPVACRRWGTPYRPHPPLRLSFGDPQDAATPGTKPPAPGTEPVTACSRRAADIVELALDSGWLGVFHESPRATVPALWAFLETVADGGPLARAPAARWLAGWVDLARPSNPAWCGPVGAPEGSPEPVASAVALAVRPGPARPGPGRYTLPRTLRLPAAWQALMRRAVEAIAQDPQVRSWLNAHKGRCEAARWDEPRLQLFVTMAALVYLEPVRPWPPPALPWPEPSSA